MGEIYAEIFGNTSTFFFFNALTGQTP